MLPISNSFQAAAVVWSLSHVEYIGVFKSQQTFLYTSVVCFPGQEAVRGSFLLKPADTLILKQPQEANLHLNHFRCFHRKSAQKHLFFFFPHLSSSSPVSPLWALIEVYIWTPDRWCPQRRPCCLCVMLWAPALPSNCTVCLHRGHNGKVSLRDWKQWPLGVRWEELRRNNVISWWLNEGI